MPTRRVCPVETPASKKGPLGPEEMDDFYFGLISEIVGVELGFHKARERYSQMLASNGIRVNPDALTKQIELVNDRLVRFLIVKHVCNRVGLSAEADNIMAAEIELVYRSRGPDPTTHKLVIGDSQR